MGKPTLFIGSSSEGLDVARAIGHSLAADAEATVWNEGVFTPGQGTLEALVNALDRFDFSVLVLTPDDLVETREVAALTARDNVLFELGLFMGRLGRARTFVVCSSAPTMKLPTDLAGVTILRFEANRADGNLVAAVSSACFQIRQAIRALGQAEARGLQRLGEATAQVEDVSERLVRLVGETQETVQNALAEVRRIPQELMACVPRRASGRPMSWESGIHWASFPVHEGNSLRPGRALQLSGGETIKYTMGFRSGRLPSQLSEILGYLVIGEWRHALKDQGELQVFASSEAPGSEMPVEVQAPSNRGEWEVAITVLSRPTAL
jgi:hypothetical protein